MHKFISAISKIFLLAALIALAGCNLPVRVPVTPTPVSKGLTSTAAVVQTATARAAVKKPTQAATVAPSDTLPPPTDTPQPTVESTITQTPTATETATETATATPQVKPSPTLGAYQCVITFVSPTSGTEILKGTTFDFKVTLRNAGVATWKHDLVDFRYLGGPRFQKVTDVAKLPADVKPGDTVTLVVDMAANSPTGAQAINWGLLNSGAIFCYVGVSIIVK